MALGFITPGIRHRFKWETKGHTGAYNPEEVGNLWGWGSTSEFALEGASTTTPRALGVGKLWRDMVVGASVASNTVGGQSSGVLLSSRQHLIALEHNGDLWGCGYGYGGFDDGSSTQGSQLGQGDQNTQQSFVQIGSDKWDRIAAGGGYGTRGQSFTVVLRNDGTLWSCGNNNSNQLGINDGTVHKLVLTQIGSDSDWTGVFAGPTSGAALKGGDLYVWGRNDQGQLGLGHLINRLEPTRVGSDSDWQSVAIGRGGGSNPVYLMMAAIKNNGDLYTCGGNGSGWLGHGDTTQRTSLTQVAGSGYTKVLVTKGVSVSSGTAAPGHWVALKADGTIVGCGGNDVGQLGLNDTTNRDEPVQIGTDTDWTDIAVGRGFTAALKSNGTLWFTGSTPHGTSSQVMTQFGSDDDWMKIAADTALVYGIRQIEDA